MRPQPLLNARMRPPCRAILPGVSSRVPEAKRDRAIRYRDARTKG